MEPKIITDDLGAWIILNKNLGRIISLVPSLTKTIADLGESESLVGVTNFCKYPENVVSKLVRLGGPKKVKINKIKELNPDIIFAVKEENSKEQIEELKKDFNVFVFDIKTVADALEMIKKLGYIFEKSGKSLEITKSIESGFKSLEKNKTFRSLYLIWKKPWMAAGKETFISSMMETAGFINIVDGRYPVVDEKSFNEAELIMLSTEPYHFDVKEVDLLKKEFPEKKIILVNGEMFAWYGTMMMEFLDYVKKLREEL